MAWTMKIDEEDRVKKEEKLSIAKNLKNLGVDIDMIIQATGLAKDKIKKI